MFDDEDIIEEAMEFVLVRTKPEYLNEMLSILDELLVEVRATRNIAGLIELPTVQSRMIKPEYVDEVNTIKHYFGKHPLVMS
ncbi:hypothetical protein [Furfurilactobacillus cerevisiae]|uniref:hypothetical protein n=1 Tax=Furfurilactobacillus rossiae TaxID=231049 RepID=UPI003B97DE01